MFVAILVTTHNYPGNPCTRGGVPLIGGRASGVVTKFGSSPTRQPRVSQNGYGCVCWTCFFQALVRIKQSENQFSQAEQRCSLQPGMAKWTPAKPNAAFRTAHEGILNSAGFCSKGEFQTARDFLLSMRPKGVAVNVGPIKTRTRPPPSFRIQNWFE